MRFQILLAGCSFLAAGNIGVAAPSPINLELTPIGSYASGIYDQGGAEIVAHDPATQRLYVVNALAATVDVLDIANPASPTKIGAIDLNLYGGVANSVAVHAGVVAVALEAFVRTDPGFVVLFNSALEPLSGVTVGAVPDMLTFTPSGRHLLVANEGEPSSYNQASSVDPEGSVSVIDLAGGPANVTQNDVRTAGFAAFNGSAGTLRAAGIRLYGPNASVAQDLEPEYIAVSFDSRIAWVTLQENNAVAVIDIATAQVTELLPLGLKDHMIADNGFSSSNALDASDRDDATGTGRAINIRNLPVMGMYQPDAIAAYNFMGQNFLVMANEGDSRNYTGFSEEILVGNANYVLDPAAFPNAAIVKTNSNLGRLQVTTATGDLDGDGDYDQIHAFGGRSFSIRGSSGNLIFDSGDQFEQETAKKYPSNFNANHTANALDGRSARKGPEPEGLALGRAFGRAWAFVGLERIGGIMIYDITDPFHPRFSNYVNNRNFAVNPGAGTIPPASPNTGDLGPEGLHYISPEDSPNGQPLLVVGNEVSGTTTIYQIARTR